MVVVIQEEPCHQPVANVVKLTMLSAFTFVSALALRDVLAQTIDKFVPDAARLSLFFTYFYASLVLLITVIMASMWQIKK